MPASCARKLRVLVISPHPSVHGGVSIFAEMMKAHFTGCEAISFFVGSRPDKKESLFALALRVVATPLTLSRLVRREHFDVVHINPSLDMKSLLRDGSMLLLLRLTGFHRVLVYFHGWQMRLADRIRHSAVIRRIFLWLLGDARAIMVLSPAFKTTLEAMGIKSSRVLLTRTMFDGSALAMGAPAAPDSARRIILYMSRFVREKGVYELLNAFARIAPVFADADLVLAGEGQEAHNLRSQVAALGLNERVTFTGYVSGSIKSAWLHRCSIFALPTYFPEGLPVALLEAMGAGKPLLTAKAGGIAGSITEPQNGIVLDAVTVDNIERALKYLLSHHDYCVHTGKHNAAYAHTYFEAKTVTAEIESVYRNCVAGYD